MGVLERPASLGLLAAAAGMEPEEALPGVRALLEADQAIETGGRIALAPGAAIEPPPSAEERRGAAERAARALALLPEAERDPAEEGRLLLLAGRPLDAAPRLLAAARRARGALALSAARALFAEAAAAALSAPSLRSRALEGGGEAALAAGLPREAAALFEEALALESERGAARAALLLLAAEAQSAGGDLPGALARIEEARLAGPSEPGRADLLEGGVHLLRGDHAAAERALSAAVRAARAPLLRSAALGELSGVHFRRAAPRRAAELLLESARLAKEAGEPRARAVCHSRLGHATEALGDRDAARRHHLRAIRLYRRAGDRAGLSLAMGNLANLLRNEGDLAGAERLYARSIRVKEELGLRSGQAINLASLSQVRLAQGKARAALRDALRASRAAKAAGEEQPLVGAMLARVEALAALGRLEEARRAARSLRRLERARPQTYGRARSRWALAHVALAAGDPAKAARLLRRAEREMARAGHPIDLVRAHALLVEAYRRAAGFPPANAAAAGIAGSAAGLAPAPSTLAPGGAGRAGAGSSCPREETSDAHADASALAIERSRAERLLASAAALAEEREVGRLLERVCDDACLLLGAERAFVVLRREDGGLDFAATRNFERENVLRPESKAPRALLETVLAEGRPVASTDALRDRRLKELTSVQMLDVRSVLAVPIRAPGGATIGALYADHRLRPGGFGEGASRLLSALAGMAAVAVARARLERALRSSEDEAATLRASLDAAREAALAAEARAGGATGEGGAAGACAARDGGAGERRGAGAGAASEGEAGRGPFGAIVGESAAIRAVKALALRVAAADLPVLILGESGTGKELLARAIHEASARRARPFVAESCAALPETLLESELFGHVRGAFTGAERERAGLFEQAHGGTLFLDEVGDTSPGLQAKLLRALQEGEVRPVGGAEPRRVNARVLAATNRDVDLMRRLGTFRDDLYFRLGAVTIKLPPLRERREDILPIAAKALEDEARRSGRKRLLLEPEAAAVLARHEWPGNVRELLHVLRAAALFAERGRIGPAALEAAGLRGRREGEGRVGGAGAGGGGGGGGGERGAGAGAGAGGGSGEGAGSEGRGEGEGAGARSYVEMRAELDAREAAFVRAAMEAAGGNKGRAAAALGMSRFALLRVLKRLGM
jgi:transcriptional regulator with GAF, ATPase, and Fis domain